MGVVRSPRRLRLGYAAVALAAFLWAVGGNVARTLLDRGASAVELTAARAWITAIGIAVFLLLRRGSVDWTPWRRLPVLVGILSFGLILATANFTYYAAIAVLPVAIAIVIQYAAPAIVVVWKAVVDRRPPSPSVLLALGLTSVGVILISEAFRPLARGSAGLAPAGVAIAVVSAFGFAGVLLLGEFLGRTVGSIPSVFGGFAVGAMFWSVVLLLRGRPETLLDPQFWPAIAFLGVATTIAPFSLFLWGLRVVGAAPAGIISTLEPVSGAMIAYLFLSQTLTGVQIVGAVAAVFGIALLQLKPSVDAPTEEVALEAGPSEISPGRR
jgi:DME family drug/metabolite transporter